MSKIRQVAARRLLRLLGWDLHIPDDMPDRSVVIGHPHTTNWDLFHTLLIAASLGIRLKWVGKQSLFEPPIGVFSRALGGVAVKRDADGGQVATLAELVRDDPDGFHLAVAVTGSRSQTRWRSGFYHIAHQAGVPVSLGFLDYASKRCGIRSTVDLTGDITADMERIADFYDGMAGRDGVVLERPSLRRAELAGAAS